MKDVYFNDLNNDDVPILTPEEIELIRKRRQQKLNNLNNSTDDSFITPPPRARDYDVDYQFDPQSYTVFDKDDTQDIPKPKYNVKSQRYYAEDEFQEEYSQPIRKQRPLQDDTESYKSSKKRGCGCLGASIFAIFLALVIAFVGTFGYFINMMNKMNIEESIENAFISASDLTGNDAVKNILLIGLDKEDGGTSRSDTMMLVTLDTVNKQLKLTSFLRDMWVEIPDYTSAKLNASYAHGGAQLTMDTIEYNFDIDVDNYVLVDFDMFRQIIDSLGGIDIEITEREAKFINRTTSSVVKAGLNHLDGKKALIYARIRKLDSDFYRTERQRKVISALVDKVKEINPIELIKIAENILPLVTTDIKALGMISTAFSALGCIGMDIQQLQVPADDAYVSKTIKGQAALVPDLEKNIENIKEFLYSKGE